MDRETGTSSMPACAQPRLTPEHRLAEVDNLLKQGGVTLSFPRPLETIFRRDMASARVSGFFRIGLFGILVYNFFLPINVFILPDVSALIAWVQLVLVSPVLALGLILIQRRIAPPELTVTVNLILIIGTIILFYSQSRAPLSGYYIFTIPVCLAFGNIVLPLPFKLSAWFTGLCVAASSAAVLSKSDQDPALAWFAIAINANSGAYLLIATFRMEAGERHAYLVNLREKLRAEILDANNMLLRSLSETDALTGVANRRAFDDWCGRLWAGARDRSEPMSILLVDIDHFKRLNDTHGHQAGDRALRCVAECLQRHASPGSIVARYGGEEFAVLVPGGNLAYSLACAEVLRGAVEHLNETANGACLPIGVTVSIGSAMACPVAGGSPADLLSAADQALYQAKATGRNRVVGFSEDAAIPALGPARIASGQAPARPEEPRDPRFPSRRADPPAAAAA